MGDERAVDCPQEIATVLTAESPEDPPEEPRGAPPKAPLAQKAPQPPKEAIKEPTRRARNGPRLYHTKSKTGCVRCRARRVKCDESRPICNNCHRHKVPCEYDRPLAEPSGARILGLPPMSQPQLPPMPLPHIDTLALRSLPGVISSPLPSSASSSAGYSSATPPYTASATAATASTPIVITGPGTGLGPATASVFNVHLVYWEMRALHKFSVATSLAMPGSHLNSIRECWALSVPVLALEYEPLLNALMALSAFHLISDGCRDPGLQRCRAAYLDAALRAHRQKLQSSLLNSKTANMACFTSVLLLVDAFAVLRGRALVPYEPPMQWLWIVRGTRSVFEASYPLVKDDPDSTIMTIISTARFSDPADFDRGENRAVFRHLMPDATVLLGEESDPEIIEAYRDCITYMGSIWTAAQAGEHTLALCRRLMGFACVIPTRFLELVELKAPRALIILAHFFAMTVHAKDVWWVGDTSYREVHAIRNYIPPEMWHLMDWPIHIVTNIDTRMP